MNMHRLLFAVVTLLHTCAVGATTLPQVPLSELLEKADVVAFVEKLIPEPTTDWNASTWILAAIGDVSFSGGYYASAIEPLEHAMHCPGAVGNPFLHLRLGQCYLEKGSLDSAADQLARAYMAEGRKIFDREDAKYFAFLKTRIKPPASGEW